MPNIKVGADHPTPDYLTAQLAWDALSGTDQGGDVIAECLGYCGVFTPTGAAVNLFHFKPASWLIHDGTNEALLPTMERAALSQTSQIIIDDIRIFTTNQYVSAFSLSSDAVTTNRCIFDNQTTGVNAIVINGGYPNTNINNFVARGGLDTINSKYLAGCNFNKGLVYGAVGYGVKGSANVTTLTDVLAFGNGTDYDTARLTLNTCASQDLTGSTGLTGYTSAELVNFSGADYRTKAVSTLATAGTIDFIGAFLESSAITSDLTGTAIPTSAEADIVAGGKTIVITITGDTFVAAGAAFDAERQGLINGLTSAQTELTGWNNEVRDKEPVTSVVRTSDTVCTITLSSSANYDITANETITSTVQATALVTSTSDVVSNQTFDVTKQLFVNVNSLLSSESIGTLTILKAKKINMTGINTSEQFGNISVFKRITVGINGFSSSELFGKLKITGGTIIKKVNMVISKVISSIVTTIIK